MANSITMNNDGSDDGLIPISVTIRSNSIIAGGTEGDNAGWYDSERGGNGNDGSDSASATTKNSGVGSSEDGSSVVVIARRGNSNATITTNNAGGGNMGGCDNAKQGKPCCSCKNQMESEKPKYPADCYSFLALYKGWPFCYGLIVFGFQIGFLFLMISSKVWRTMSANEDVDNPDSGKLASFIPANVSLTVRATQILAALAFLLFADESLNDVAKAVEFYRYSRRKASTIQGDHGVSDTSNYVDCRDRMICSCALRFTQGMWATLTALLLVMTSSDVIEIVLNFTAVNFISSLDEMAFELAKSGRYGTKLKEKAEEIEERPLPKLEEEEKLPLSKYTEHRKKEEVQSYWFAVAMVAPIFLIMITVVISYQENYDVWTTKTLRVQFKESSGLQSFNGCYESNGKEFNRDRRKVYESHQANEASSVLGYCNRDRQWVFFKENVEDLDPNPCEAGANELAHSSQTNSFDISTVFEIPWFSAYNTPLDMYFIQQKNEDYLEGNCESFVNDGKCDDAFNNYIYEYDGGDCCATTCTEPEECGIGVLQEAFGGVNINGVGDGFPHCIDPVMVDLTTRLDNLTFQEIPLWASEVYSQNDTDWKAFRKPLIVLECDDKTIFSIPIDNGMINKTHTAKMEDEAGCILTVSNFDPIWYADVTIENESYSNDTVEVLRKNSIPNEIGSLELLKNLDLFNKALTGTIPNKIESLTNLRNLNLGFNLLSGTIPTEIGLLVGLTSLNLNGNSLTGTIPTEIENLVNLTSLNLLDNYLSGYFDCTKLNPIVQHECERHNTLSPSPFPTGIPTEMT